MGDRKSLGDRSPVRSTGTNRVSNLETRSLEELSSHPSRIHVCEQILEDEFGTERVLLTTSCAKALEVAAMLVGIGPESEVILPSFTHPATANAFALRGAHLVFADVCRETCNIDPASIADGLSARTKCVVPVHYGGVACQMEAIQELVRGRKIDIVEDAAHAIGAKYRNRPLGTIGRIGAISFHETKNVSCIKGGALLINDPSLVSLAEEVVDHGTNRLRFTRGQVERYSWQCVGTDAVLAEPLAATLLEEIERRGSTLRRRIALWGRYYEELSGWAARIGVKLPTVPEEANSNAHLFYLLFADPPSTRRFMTEMRQKGVIATSHFEPLHLSPMGKKLGYTRGDFPVTENLAATLVRLPLSNEMEDVELAKVIDAVIGFE